MNRRGFLTDILAAGVAPAIVGSGVLMPLGKIWTPEQKLVIPQDGLLKPFDGDDTLLAILAWGTEWREIFHQRTGQRFPAQPGRR